MGAQRPSADRRPSREEQLYAARTPRSRLQFERGREHLPGADSRSPLFYPPYPAVLESGRGCELVDVDGNVLLDFTSNHSSLVLGYGNPVVVAAVERQLAAGTAFPGPTEPQLALAERLTRRIPSMRRVRFTSSGTEAVLIAVRAARAFTGRPKLAKVDGGYHGTADPVLVSTTAGDGAASAGLAPGTVENAVVIPFNDTDAAERILEAHGAELAAVIVEPVMGAAGMIPAEPEYLAMLRDVTRRHGMLLVFDEVISFRIAHGGAQAHHGVEPDLTCLGKAIGGGFPLGVLGGRADVMSLFDPSQGPPAIPHPGSLNANPVSLVAGAATLDVLTPEAIDLLNAHGDRLRSRSAEVLAGAGLAAQVTGWGSLFAIHFTRGPVRSHRDAAAGDPELRHRLFLGLFNEGVLIDPRGVGCTSLATGTDEVDAFIDALARVAAALAERRERTVPVGGPS